MKGSLNMTSPYMIIFKNYSFIYHFYHGSINYNEWKIIMKTEKIKNKWEVKWFHLVSCDDNKIGSIKITNIESN